MKCLFSSRIAIFTLFSQFFTYHVFSNAHAIAGQNSRPLEPNEYRYVVCIVRYNPQGTWEDNLSCTGTLLANMFVLTAEHCFNDASQQQYEISIGTQNIQEGVNYYPIWWVSYDQWSLLNHIPIQDAWNDISIIKLFGLPLDIVPATVALNPDVRNLYGMQTTAVGCGKINENDYPQVMHAGNVRVIPLNDCKSVIEGLQGFPIPLTEKFYCSIGVPHAYIEMGDSGGPLIYFGGVIALNIARCPLMDGGTHTGQVNIHINLHYYRNFLHNIMQGNLVMYV